MERGNGGSVMRRDSGWQPASDGRFDFPAGSGVITHPGVVRGITHVTNIRDTGQRFTTGDGTTELMAVRFDCMVDMEHTISGSGPDGVPVHDMLGYVQLTNVLPMGPDGYSELLGFAGPLGGAIDCTLDRWDRRRSLRPTRQRKEPPRRSTHSTDRGSKLAGNPSIDARHRPRYLTANALVKQRPSQ